MDTPKHTRAARNLTRPLPTITTAPTIGQALATLATLAVAVALITYLLA